jgi:hypothetical protein
MSLATLETRIAALEARLAAMEAPKTVKKPKAEAEADKPKKTANWFVKALAFLIAISCQIFRVCHFST